MELIQIAQIILAACVATLIGMFWYDKGVRDGAESIKPVVDRAINFIVKKERIHTNEVNEKFNEDKTMHEIGKALGVKIAKTAKK